jgi:ABC-type branched-subunit amino acid transport system permease subunit
MNTKANNGNASRSNAVVAKIVAIPSLLSKNRTLIAILAFLYMLPLGTAASTSPVRTLIYVLTRIMILGLLAMSFDLQLGRASLLNFGHVALFGVSAYIMAYTLQSDFLPPPFNLIAAIPYPFTIILAMMIGAGIGLVMGLTTSRMKGTAFAFIALAIAMFIYNFFAQSPAISGGETGLTVPTPDIIRTGPFYLFFVIIAFVFLAAFIGMIILYLKKWMDNFNLILVTPVMICLLGILFVFGSNSLGTILVALSFLMLGFLFLIQRDTSIGDPLQYVESQPNTSEDHGPDRLTAYILPFAIILIALVGVLLAFADNISQMFGLWVEDSSTFYFTIPVQYYLVLTCVVITYVFIRRLMTSPFGRMITAVAQNEERAEALGYNSYRAKVVLLVISGAIAGLAGALYAPYLKIIDPETTLGVGVTIDAMLFTIIGGIGTLFGPILGTGVVAYSELNLVDFFTSVLNWDGRFWLVGLGVMYIVIVLFMPLGIVGSTQRKFNSIKGKLQRLKLGRYEFGLKDGDYWIFGLIGAIGIVLLLSEESKFFPIVLGIFGFLDIIGLFLLVVFRKEIISSLKGFGSKLKLALGRFASRLKAVAGRKNSAQEEGRD